MLKTIQRAFTGTVVTVMATAGLIAVNPAAPKAEAACNINRYKVIWSQSGVYDSYWWLVKVKYYGQVVEGYHGGHYVYYSSTLGEWMTSVYLDGYNYGYTMKSRSLQYMYCY